MQRKINVILSAQSLDVALGDLPVLAHDGKQPRVDILGDLVHIQTPLLDDLHSVLKTQSTGGDERGIFPQAVACNNKVI